MTYAEKIRWARMLAKLIALNTNEDQQNELIFNEMGFSWWTLSDVAEGREKFEEAFEEILGVPFDEAEDIILL